MLHKKSQSTSALSVILSARDQPPAPSHLPSGHYLPSLSEGESQQVASTPSRRTETRSRISHSRTKSDLASLASESRFTSNTPTRIRRRELPAVPRSAHPADDSQRSTPQPVRRREAVSSTEEDTSDASDLDLAKSRQSRVLGKEVAGRPNRTPLGTSREDIQSDQTRKTPGKDPSTSERTRRENGFQDFTLDHCVIVLMSLRTSPSERLRALRFIERELAQTCLAVDPLGISLQAILSKRLHIPLLANFRADAQYLLRLRSTNQGSPSTLGETLLCMEVLLNVLQGIVMLGVRQHGELQLAMDTVENIKEALMDPWVVEALVDLLSLAQTEYSTTIPTHEILNTLFTILVNLPPTLPAFTSAGGYEAIAGLLKLARKEVKVKAVEFLVYLGTLAAEEVNNAGNGTDNVETIQQTRDVFGLAESIDSLPSTPKRKLAPPVPRSRHTPRDRPADRASSGNSTASTATNQADIDLLRTPIVSDYGSDVDVWTQEQHTGEEGGIQPTGTPLGGNINAFQFPKSQSSSALASHGFYTPQQRSEKHHPSRAATSGSSQGSQEDSGTFKPPAQRSTIMRRSSLSVRPSTTQQRVPSLRSLARVEEELAITPKKLVDMSPARLKADFRDSEVRKEMCSTVKMRGSSRPSSALRSPRIPNAGRNQPITSESETASTPTSRKGLTRDSSRTSLLAGNPSKSTDPRLLIPSGKVNIGLGFPGIRSTPSSAGNTLQADKGRTSSAEYPLELARDSRIRGLAPIRTSGTEKRVSSNGSNASHKSSSSVTGMRKSQTLSYLSRAVSDDGPEQTGTIRRSDV